MTALVITLPRDWFAVVWLGLTAVGLYQALKAER